MIRRRRILAAFLAAFALLFAQFAVSAHVCILPVQMAKVEVMAHHDCCAEAMDSDELPGNGNVCAGHCQYGHASFGNGQPAPAIGDAIGPALRIEVAAPVVSTDARNAWRFAPAASPSPPAILFGVLRI
jgi:hypothetical protein